LGFEGVHASAQTAELHRIAAIALTPEGRPLLTLAGGAGGAFRNYFDLFRPESSADLARWNSLATVVRTNAATNALTFLDATETNGPQRFHRTASNHVLTWAGRGAGEPRRKRVESRSG